MEDNDEDAIEPIVLDCGSAWFKAGFAGDDAPRSIFPSVVGRPRHRAIGMGFGGHDPWVGYEATSKRGILEMNVSLSLIHI